jgi:tetratricopeptide (TPR) repeat protein
MANRDDHSDVDNPQIQLDVVEAAKWAIGQAFRRTVEDIVASATAYYVGLRGLPSPEVQATLSREVQGRLQAAEAVEANAAQVASPTFTADVRQVEYLPRFVVRAPNLEAFNQACLDTADRYYLKQDYSAAAHWYHIAADKGNATAQYNVGLMYYTGTGVATDDAQAFEWFRRAAAQGLADAQNYLGRMYDDGRGVERSWPAAAGWYRLAADQGNVNAWFNLGLGLHRQADYEAAAFWFRKAAEHNDVEAQHNLGGCMSGDMESLWTADRRYSGT